MIQCNEINQKANELLVKFKQCLPLSINDRVDLLNLIIAINNCSGGEGIAQDNINKIFELSLEDINATSFNDDIPLLLSLYINEENIIISETEIAYFEISDEENKEIYIVKGFGKGLLEITPQDLLKIEDLGPKVYINDDLISNSHTWSSSYISQLLNIDRFLTRGNITTIDTEVFLSTGYKWIISQFEYENTVPWSYDIPTTSPGMLRRDIIVADTNNSFYVVEGDESSTNPIAPQTPPNTLLVTIIPVYDGGIGDPIEPEDPTDNLFQQDIPVSLTNGKTLGKYLNGETIPAIGKTAEEVIRDIAFEYLLPSFTSFGITQTTPIEVGTVISGNKNFTFAFQYPENIENNSISIIDVTNSNTVIGSGLSKTSPVTANIGNISKTAVATHQWRASAVNTQSNTIQSALATVTWNFRYFRGAVSAIPADGAALRTTMLSNSIISNGNTFSFTTGTTLKDFVIAIPNHKTLVEAKNMGTNENLPFVLSDTITTVPDAGGTPRAYKVYTLSNAVPFSSNYNINITLS